MVSNSDGQCKKETSLVKCLPTSSKQCQKCRHYITAKLNIHFFGVRVINGTNEMLGFVVCFYPCQPYTQSLKMKSTKGRRDKCAMRQESVFT